MRTDLKKGGKRKGDSLVEKDGRLMSPFLDWTFKHMFATEESKSNLIGLLNLILMPQVPIVDVTYLNNEVLPVAPEMKGCVFDIICEDENGERYLIEMQNQKAMNVKERIIYYTCRMIDRMGLRGGKWNYQDIKKAYTICMMNFTYEANPILRRDIQLYDVKLVREELSSCGIIQLDISSQNGICLISEVHHTDGVGFLDILIIPFAASEPHPVYHSAGIIDDSLLNIHCLLVLHFYKVAFSIFIFTDDVKHATFHFWSNRQNFIVQIGYIYNRHLRHKNQIQQPYKIGFALFCSKNVFECPIQKRAHHSSVSFNKRVTFSFSSFLLICSHNTKL